MQNDLSFKILVAVILSGLVLACANPTPATSVSSQSLQANSTWTSRLFHPVSSPAKS